jgi:uncharacterized protein
LYNYRFDHVQEVVELAKHLATGTEANMEVIVLSAWLHDLVKPGIGGIPAQHHGIASAELAEDILSKEGIDNEIIVQVCDAIRKHVGLTIREPLEPIESQILWEADKILKLGMIGLLQHLLNIIRIKPGQNLPEISIGLKEVLPLAKRLKDCFVTEKGRVIAEERLQKLHILSNMLEAELNL